MKEIEKVWKSGKFQEGDWKSMEMWQILTRALKKYENLAGEALEGSTKLSSFFCHLCEGFFIFTKMSYFFCLFLYLQGSIV